MLTVITIHAHEKKYEKVHPENLAGLASISRVDSPRDQSELSTMSVSVNNDHEHTKSPQLVRLTRDIEDNETNTVQSAACFTRDNRNTDMP